jgi:hypothetical protein
MWDSMATEVACYDGYDRLVLHRVKPRCPSQRLVNV